MQHTHDLSRWKHRHDFAQEDHHNVERRTWWVVGITVVMMAGEITAGLVWHSMALLADGWHMGTHAVAIGVAAMAYRLSKRWAGDTRFSLGPWKVEVLGAYTSAVLLGAVAFSIVVESVQRLLSPAPIAYDESLGVAVLGLGVNLVCAWLLHGSGNHHHHPHHGGHGHEDAAHPHNDHGHAGHPHQHDHDAHGHGHAGAHAKGHHGHDDHGHDHGDLNLRAAYLHVVADAATSVLAIGALMAGKYFGWVMLDPLIGLLGAVLIALWAKGLVVRSATILLDREMDHPLAGEVRRRLESDGDSRVADLHFARVSNEGFAVHATVVAGELRPADAYRERLADLAPIAHVSVEVNRCDDCAAPPH